MLTLPADCYEELKKEYADSIYDNLLRMHPSSSLVPSIRGKQRALQILFYEMHVFEIIPDKLRQDKSPYRCSEEYIECAVKWLLTASFNELKEIADILRTKKKEYENLCKDEDKLNKPDRVKLKNYREGYAFLKYFQKNAYKTLRTTTVKIYDEAGVVSELLVPEALVHQTGIRICPYCGRSFIGIQKRVSEKANIKQVDFWEDDGDKTVNLGIQLDHFFNRDMFPFLSVSLYNLIPCCGICNLLKSNKDKKGLVSPFEIAKINEAFDFRFDYEELPGIGQTREVRILVNKGVSSYVSYEENINLFHLREAYAFHQIEAAEFCEKMMCYPKSQIEEISRMLYNDNTKPNDDKDHRYTELVRQEIEDRLERHLFSEAFTEERDIGKRPLAKLYRDLYKNYRK